MMGMSEFPFLFVYHLTFISHILIFITIREARIIFKAGRNRDGWFDADDLLQQVDKAIDIFEGLTKGWAQGLFLFDNAPSHQKRAPNAISARNMVKGALIFSVSHHHQPLRPSTLHVTVLRTMCGMPQFF
jgi:hypothetical protein